nr:MAG TPA: hypothetical protein [Caudoviricetes sp.]
MTEKTKARIHRLKVSIKETLYIYLGFAFKLD